MREAPYPVVAVYLLALFLTSCTNPPQTTIGQRGTTIPTVSTAAASIRIHAIIMGANAPLAQIQVEVYKDRFEPTPGDLVTSGISDIRGFVDLELQPGTYGVWLSALGLANQWRYAGPTRFTFTQDQEVRFNMQPAF